MSQVDLHLVHLVIKNDVVHHVLHRLFNNQHNVPLFICKNLHIPGRKRIRNIGHHHYVSRSSRDRRRSKSRSRGNEDRTKKEQPSQSETTPSSAVVAPATLSSKIETVPEETTDKTQEENSKNGKKHKKHHKKHRHSSSKSKKHHRSKDKEKKSTVDTATSVVEVQS